MTRFAISILIIIASMLTACSKKDFHLEFSLPADINTNYTAVYYASDKRGGMTIESVAVISKGKGSLRCPTVKPCLLYLYAGTGIPLTIYAEKGETINISGSEANPYAWTVDGNDINRQLSAWRNQYASTLRKNIPDSINMAVSRFVTANPSAMISPILLLTAFSRSHDETLFRRLWHSLDVSEARTWARLVARSDIPDGISATPGQLRSIALRSLGNGLDTIRPDSVKASLLFFWNNGFDNRRQVFDSIKTLAKEFPDSASRIIADICLDPDSLGWRSPLRFDSLRNVVRMWAPAGMADRRIMKLGVVSSPFYIVFSPDGHQRYRGDSQEKAFREFRKLAGAGNK